jgi:hypothetical protein
MKLLHVIKYSPSQPRVGAGSPDGGQFAGDGVETRTGTDLRNDMLGRVRRAGGLTGTGLPNAVAALAFRESRKELFDMALYIERASDQDAMLRATSSQMEWNTNWAGATDEWQAAQALGASKNMGKATKDEIKERGKALSEKDVAAFKARQSFVAQHVRAAHGETVTVYRGIGKRQADKLRGEEGEPWGREVDLPVYGLSSWSTKENIAAGFAGEKGFVVKAQIPASRAWNTNELVLNRLVNFSDDHGEIAFTHGEATEKVTIVSYGTRRKSSKSPSEESDLIDWMNFVTALPLRHAPTSMSRSLSVSWGIKFDPSQPRDEQGEWTEDGIANARTRTPHLSEKAKRAKAAHVMVDKEIQRYCEQHNEGQIAKALGGVSFPDSEPIDIAVPGPDGIVKHGIELKTMVANSNAKLTMKTDAQKRKRAWERKNKATVHTLVLDDSKVFNAKGPGKHDLSKRIIYYRRGYGSFRISSMHKVANMAEVKTLLNTPTRQLPPGAKSMSLSLQINEDGEQLHLATNRGWGEVQTWADSLNANTYPRLVQFIEYGITEKVADVLSEMHKALRDHGPKDPNVLTTMLGLLKNLDANSKADVVLVTNGMSPVKESSDTGKAVKIINVSKSVALAIDPVGGVKYNPNQPRDPAGSPTGGQWSGDGESDDLRERDRLFHPDVRKEAHRQGLKVLRDNSRSPILHRLDGFSNEDRKKAKIEVTDRIFNRADLDKIDDALSTFLEKDEITNTDRKEFISKVVDQWAETSFDHDAEAVAIQLVANEEFGLENKFPTVDSDTMMEADQLAQDNNKGYREVLRTMYKNTQDDLARMGVKELTLYRGVYHAEGDETMPDGVYRGEFKTHPIASWSSHFNTAKSFAATSYADAAVENGGEGGQAVIMAAKIPASRILSTSRTGLGCLNEYEFTVLSKGGSGKFNYSNVTTDVNGGPGPDDDEASGDEEEE